MLDTINFRFIPKGENQTSFGQLRTRGSHPPPLELCLPCSARLVGHEELQLQREDYTPWAAAGEGKGLVFSPTLQFNLIFWELGESKHFPTTNKVVTETLPTPTAKKELCTLQCTCAFPPTHPFGIRIAQSSFDC